MKLKISEVVIGSIIIGLFVFIGILVDSELEGNTIKSFGGRLVEYKVVTKIIDGDTIIVEGGESVRLLGIDADERGKPCYTEAKNRLEELILDKRVKLEPDIEDKDQYGRSLRYLFLNGTNMNLLLIKEGLAIARFTDENVKYKKEIINAEKKAMDEKIGCKWKD